MPFPTAVDAIVDAPPVTAATRIQSSQVLGPQRVVVGPLLFNVLSDLYSSSSTVAAKVTAAVADANFGNNNGLVVIPPTASGMAAPAAPSVTVQGAAGTTTYMYFVIAINAAGDVVVSQTTTIANGNAALTVSNFNAVTWNAVTGATSYKLVRLIIGGTEGVVFTGSVTNFNDQGGAVTTFTYPATNLNALTESTTVLDLRYLPTNQAAGITRSVTDILNTNQTATFKLNRTFGGGADNAAVLALTSFLTGGSGSTAGPDGEVATLYAENTRRAGSTRGMWAANFNIASDVAPAASIINAGLEVDVNNNGGANATASTPFDGVSVLAAGSNNSRFGFFVANSGTAKWLDGIHIGNIFTNFGVNIDPVASGLSAGSIFAGNDIDCDAHIRYTGTTPTLGALQTNVSSQSIAGNDNRGNVTITSGTPGPAFGANFAIVNFANARGAYPSTPTCVPAGWSNRGDLRGPAINAPSTTSFTFVNNDGGALPSAVTLVAQWFVAG